MTLTNLALEEKWHSQLLLLLFLSVESFSPLFFYLLVLLLLLLLLLLPMLAKCHDIKYRNRLATQQLINTLII